MKRILLITSLILLISITCWPVSTDTVTTEISRRQGLWSSKLSGNRAICHQLPSGDLRALQEMRIHLNNSVLTSAPLVLVLDDVGTTCDVELDRQGMLAKTDYVFRPTREIIIKPTDALKVTFTNANNLTWGIEFIWRKP